MTVATAIKTEIVPIRSSPDVVLVRQRTRAWASEIHFGLVDQTKIVTAASELARNTLIYGGGGSVEIALLENAGRTGMRLSFSDKGPGIPDIALAMKDGYTTGSGIGLGLGGSKRLMNEFSIESKPGSGTTVTVIRWK